MAEPDPQPDYSSNGSLPSGGNDGIVVAAVVLLVVAVVMTMLWVFTTGPVSEKSAADEALDYIPIDATKVEIRDQRVAEQRLGIHEVETGADAAQILAYLTKARDNPTAINGYTDHLATMSAAGAGFTALDVDWTASALAGPESSSAVVLYGMDAALDLDKVADDMVDAGWTASEVDDGLRLTFDSADVDPVTRLVGDYATAPTGLRGVLLLLPDEHLMVFGDYERVLDVLAGDSEPLRAAADVSELLDTDGNPEYVHLVRGEQTCVDDVGALMFGVSRLSRSKYDRILQQSEGLAVPAATATLAFVDGDKVTMTSRLLFDHEDEAVVDMDARARYLREGMNFRARKPIAKLFTVHSITVDGAVETITYTFERGVPDMVTVSRLPDYPPTLCLDL